MKPTRDEILREPASERLDAWIAEFVFGDDPPKEFACPRCGGGCFHALWPDHKILRCNGYALQHGSDGGCGWEGTWADVAHLPYSDDIAAAWLVVDKMRAETFSKRHAFDKELTEIMSTPDGSRVAWPWAIMYLEPVHICRAALLVAIAGEGARHGYLAT